MNMDINLLESVAVDRTVLATNLPDMPDCTGAGLDPKTAIINQFPLVAWLLGTSLTQRTRARLNEDRAHCIMHKDGNGKYIIEVPRGLWSLTPEETSEECCWQPIDFATCSGNVPVNLLCLKDCDSIMDELVGRTLRFGEDVDGLAAARETQNEIKRRVARMSMAFYTAITAIQGHDNVYTNILKPFHGLMEVLENPAVATINGTNILSAFDQAYCRLAFLDGVVAFAVNPVLYQTLLELIVPSQYGLYPNGWNRTGDDITFHGMRFIQDRLVPVDIEDGTSEVWGLNGDAVGLYLATDLMPGEEYIRLSGHQEQTAANGCGTDCTYYYNLGTALANNSNKILRIVDVPITGACSTVIGDLEGLVNPTTLIPAV